MKSNPPSFHLPVPVDASILAQLVARARDERTACRAVLCVLVARHEGIQNVSVDGVRVDLSGMPDADELFRRVNAATASDSSDDLALRVENGALVLAIRGARFDADAAERIAGQIAVLARGLATEALPVARLPILSAREEARILALTCVRDVRVDEFHPTIVALFDKHVLSCPDAIAVVDGDRTLTYAELDVAAARIARRIGALELVQAPVVALYVERGADAVIAFWGILKARAIYVPIDTSYPAGRVGAILEVARPRVVITRRALSGKLPGEHRFLFVDDEPSIASTPLPSPTSLDVAYTIFTSGSTGRPKGVEVDHRTLANYARAVEDCYGFGPGDRVLQGASLGFDLSLEEIIVTLTSGATLVVRSAPPIESVQTFVDECVQREITILSITSALWHELTLRLEDGSVGLPPRLRLVILGADAARPDILAVWQALTGGRVRLVNSYGLTETTIVATTWEASQEPLGPGWRALPVGTPLRNTSAYVLDEHDAFCPIGVAGEVCIGGLAVARRYVGDDDLTRARFVDDPFLPGQRMYRTGDRGLFRPDGQLEFLGRSDYQLKVNGVRIELGEIEARIREIAGVVEGIVIARKNPAGEAELEAHVMVSADIGAETVREHLVRVLPLPTVPARILVVDRFPLTAAGKIDRRALAEVVKTETSRPTWVPPRSPLERTVLATVGEVLGMDRVGLRDAFAALGGTSLSAVRAASMLGKRLGRTVRARQLLQATTFHDVCAELEVDTTTECHEDLERDARLHEEIRPLTMTERSPLERVFLTGATGFYGTFVLAELLHATRAHVVCLVRAADAASGLQRVKKSLARHACVVAPEMIASRVSIVIGDLAEPGLGLAPAEGEALAASIDTIVHVGAAVNLLLPYSSLRAANVRAVEDVLRLATSGRSKSVHHVSTVEVLTDTDPSAPGAWLERPAAASPLRLHDGYGQSKWVAEKLVEAARARGIRAFIHRPGRLMGHARTGAFNPEDFLVRILDACGQVGAAPILGTSVDITPVDYAARALVRLAALEPLSEPAFHFVNPHVITWTKLVARIVSAGYFLRSIPHGEWCRILEERARSSAQSDFLLYLAGMSKEELEASMHGGPVGDRTRALLGTTVVCPPVDAALVETYLAKLVADGRFDGSRRRPDVASNVEMGSFAVAAKASGADAGSARIG